jgi:hypothetical protein
MSNSRLSLGFVCSRERDCVLGDGGIELIDDQPNHAKFISRVNVA